MSLDINQAQAPLEFIPPALNPFVLRITQLLLPAWIRSQTILSQIEAENVKTLVKLVNEFQQKKIRFLIAFRHPQVEDPFSLGYLLFHIVPKDYLNKLVNLSHAFPLAFDIVSLKSFK